MTASTQKNLQRLSSQALDLGLAAPQVIALRLSQFALAGAAPKAGDIAEFNRMIVEKQVAFFQSWQAAISQSIVVQQSIAASMFQLAFSPWRGNSRAASGALLKQVQNATLTIASKSLKPVRNKAVANAKRLSRR